MVLITLLSLFSFSDDEVEGIWIPHLDKIVHAIFHFLLVILGILSLKEVLKKNFRPKSDIIKVLGFSIAYGILIEALQYYMPYDRAAEVWDVLANLTGALLGVLLIKQYLSLTSKLK